MKRLIALSVVALCYVGNLYAQEIVAHRGYHAAKGAVENSMAALNAAIEAGLSVVECDVNMTSDGELVVVNGPWLGKRDDADRLNIQRSDLATLRSKRLANGEQVPTLDDFLAVMATNEAIRLIIDIRDHATPQIESDVVRKVVAAVKQHKVQGRVVFTASRQHICNELVRLAPSNSEVLYLAGNLTPRYVEGLGYTGIGYSLETLRRLPRWIDEARKLDLKVGIWAVNSADDATWAILQGVDYIATDAPAAVQEVME